MGEESKYLGGGYGLCTLFVSCESQSCKKEHMVGDGGMSKTIRKFGTYPLRLPRGVTEQLRNLSWFGILVVDVEVVWKKEIWITRNCADLYRLRTTSE